MAFGVGYPIWWCQQSDWLILGDSRNDLAEFALHLVGVRTPFPMHCPCAQQQVCCSHSAGGLISSVRDMGKTPQATFMGLSGQSAKLCVKRGARHSSSAAKTSESFGPALPNSLRTIE